MNKPQGDHTDWSDKLVFSTGEAAKVCRVSQQTIIRCFDSGRLQGFRVPGSKFRRIPRDELIRFMRANDIPVTRLDGLRRRVVCIVEPGDALSGLADVVEADDRIDILVAGCGFDAGWACREARPNLVLVGSGIAGSVRAAVSARYASFTSGRPLIVHVGESDDPAADLRIEAVESVEAVVRRLVGLLDESEGSGDA